MVVTTRMSPSTHLFMHTEEKVIAVRQAGPADNAPGPTSPGSCGRGTRPGGAVSAASARSATKPCGIREAEPAGEARYLK